MMTAGTKLGLELESVVVHRDSGVSLSVMNYFPALAAIKEARGESIRTSTLEGLETAVSSATGESGLDCSFTLLETAFAPVEGGAGGLTRLAKIVRQGLADDLAALASDKATLLNASEHPTSGISDDWYARVCVPRPIYAELVGFRGWFHQVGSDAKAQNSACTSIDIWQATSVLNMLLALAPASIAIFANSPLENGVLTGLKENRLTMWERMFSTARFAGDRALQQLPDRPFDDLGDYFRWMFGPLTVSRALPVAFDQSYKSNQVAYLKDDPPLSRFLKRERWLARQGSDGAQRWLTPCSEHFVYSQFAQFLDARFRYRLAEMPPLQALLAAWDRPNGIEALFDAHGVDGYIEGRAAGSVLPDAQLINAAGHGVADSVAMAPSAFQLGLMRNVEAGQALVNKWGWSRLRKLRSHAIRDALADDAVHALAKDTLAVAIGGLDADERHFLRYAEYVVQTRSTGADRLIELWNRAPGSAEDRMALVCRDRSLVLPANTALI